VLLSDAKVAAYLKENFVLCWNSVRPVPKVTIDFGNGKTLERTIKGNTTFHVCLPDGRVVDSLPGVYHPDDFLLELEESRVLAQLSEEEILDRHREVQLAQATVDLQEAIGKGAVEAPLVRVLEPNKPSRLSAQPGEIVDVSALPMSFDDYVASYLPGEGSLAERAIEADSNSSLTVLRPAVHKWFASLARLPQPAQARGPIYKDILKVDIDDPYLGLKVDGLPGTR
jgi:hypothetical protein